MQAIQLELDLGDALSGGIPLGAPHPGGAASILADQNRVKLLDALYVLDGRDQPSHPHRGTYTGLAEAFHQAIGRLIVERATESPEFEAQLLGDGRGFGG
jgi:hypothetical protein